MGRGDDHGAGPEITWDGSVATLTFDGQLQSCVDVEHPAALIFEYMQHLGLAIDAVAPDGPLRVTHVGGAGLTLARWVQATRPGSPQIVLEPDAALTELVRRELPLPRGHRIRVRPVTGEDGIADLKPGSADVLVVDAYAGGQVPETLGSIEWLAAAGSVLAPGGLLLMNLADEPGRRWVSRVGAGVGEAVGDWALLGLHEVLKGKRFGNTILVASRSPLNLFDLRRAAAGAALPTGLLVAGEVLAKAPGARPFSTTARDVAASPPPPAPGAWRVR